MRRIDVWLMTLVAVAVPAAVAAQGSTPAVLVPPINILLPNYNSVAAGEIGSLEANAFVTRANDASSAYYNPAGLTLATQTSVSGSAGVYQSATVTPQGLPGKGGSFQQIPSLVGLVVPKLFGRDRLAGGFSLSRTNAWDQSTDLQRQVDLAAASERIQYSSTGHLSGLRASLGLGYARSPRLRLGGTIDVEKTDSARSQSLSDQYATAGGLSALLITSHGSSQFWHLRMTAGVQYDVGPGLRVAAVIRTPGARIARSGTYAYEGIVTAGAAKSTASFFDTGIEADYRLPAEYKAGVAWVGARGQVEFDVLGHGAGGRYDAIRTGQSWQVVTDSGQGGAPAVQRPALTSPVIDSRGVVNIAAGGQFRLTPDGAWTIHGGYATDRSPVGADDTTFTHANMQVVTAGISGKTSLVLGSVGIRYETGTTEDLTLRVLQSGNQLRTRLKISNLGLVYSVAIRF